MAGGIVGGIVGNLVGQLAGQVMNQALSSMLSQFGLGQMANAFSNIFNNALGSGLKGAIDNGPLPQFMKDAANSAIDDIIGNSQQHTSPECQRACEDSDMASALRDLGMQIAKEFADDADKKCDGRRTGGGKGQSWLEVLAGSMADIQNKFLNKVMESRDKLEAAAGKEGQKGQQEFIMAQNEYQAQMQMFKQMSEIASTTLKTIGEALSTLSRKQ